MDQVTTLVAFLKARLDEDEAAAKAWLPFGNPDAAARDHVARYDPGRVLAEVDAKREVIRLYEDTIATIEMLKSHGWQSTSAHEVAAESYLNVIRAHAAAYADHPDYRDEWRP
jgi:hypothetical protein